MEEKQTFYDTLHIACSINSVVKTSSLAKFTWWMDVLLLLALIRSVRSSGLIYMLRLVLLLVGKLLHGRVGRQRLVLQIQLKVVNVEGQNLSPSQNSY
jgi:positive regulator of sigma E activity